MRALALAAALLLTASASAQEELRQGLHRPPPPGQPAGPIVPPAPSAPEPGASGPIRPEGTLVVVERELMESRLARMESLLDKAFERSERGQGRGVLRQVRDEMDALRHTLAHAPDVRSYRPPAPPPPPPPVPVVQPISDEQFQRISKAIARESFSEGKMRVLEAAVANHHFLVPQVMKLLQRFSFAGDRLQVVKVLWPRVLDRENGYQLYEAFTFASDKEKLRQVIST
jgi:uncharacterized protein DUF4476